MIKTFTQEKLLRYVYNELPAEEHAEMEHALAHDAELATICADLLLAQRTLNSLQQAPRAATTEAILQYSRTFLQAG